MKLQYLSTLLLILISGCRKEQRITAASQLPFENERIRLELASSNLPPVTYITDMVFASEDSGLIISHDGRIFGTSDGGRSWSMKFTNPVANQPLLQILYARNHTAYVAGGSSSCNGAGCKVPGGLVLKTMDGGETWNTVYEKKRVEFSEISQNSKGDLFLLSSGGGTGNLILKSMDGGENWTESGNLGLKEKAFGICFSDNRGFCLSAEWGKFIVTRSDDNGNSWSHRTEFEGTWYGGFAFSGHTGYCITDISSIYQTTDNGENWTQMNPSPIGYTKLASPLSSGSCLIWGRGEPVNSRWGDAHYYNGGLMHTNDSGRTWTDYHFTDIQNVRKASFYSSTEGYALTDKRLIKVVLK